MNSITEGMIEAAAQALADRNHSPHPEAFRGIAECALTAAISAGEAVQPVAQEALIEAAVSGWNACRCEVYLLSEDYIERTHALKSADSVEGNFYRGQYDVAKSFAKAFSAFEALDCRFFQEIDFLHPAPASAGVVPDGWQLVPKVSTAEMEDAARHLMMWLDFSRPSEQSLIAHCKRLGKEPPLECRDVDHVPPKALRLFWIYRAMLAAAPADGGKP